MYLCSSLRLRLGVYPTSNSFLLWRIAAMESRRLLHIYWFLYNYSMDSCRVAYPSILYL
jgi:hypothetical protein